MTTGADTPPIRDRFRIRFAKTGLLRWIGHRDLQRLWERLLRRADLRLSMSAGFHPKPRINFPSALALGIEGLDEVVEIELAQTIDAAELRRRLIADNQPGLEIGEVQLAARLQPDGTADPAFPAQAKARLHSSVYEITLPPAVELQAVDAAIAQAKQQAVITIQRRDKPVTAEIATAYPRLERCGHTLHLTHVDAAGATLKPTELLDAIGLADLTQSGAIIRRTKVVLIDQPEHPPNNLIKERR